MEISFLMLFLRLPAENETARRDARAAMKGGAQGCLVPPSSENSRRCKRWNNRQRPNYLLSFSNFRCTFVVIISLSLPRANVLRKKKIFSSSQTFFILFFIFLMLAPSRSAISWAATDIGCRFSNFNYTQKKRYDIHSRTLRSWDGNVNSLSIISCALPRNCKRNNHYDRLVKAKSGFPSPLLTE